MSEALPIIRQKFFFEKKNQKTFFDFRPSMKHWRLDDVDWVSFDPAQVDDRDVVAIVKAAAMVERNGTDYAIYLNNIFRDDPAFRAAADNWAVEEVQHGDALGRWAMLADPAWNYEAAFARYKAGYQIPLDADTSIRGSLTGELIARCMVETGTSSYYTALAEATAEPVLQQVCRLIAADEYRTSSCSTTTCAATSPARRSASSAACASRRPHHRKRGRRTRLRLPLRQRAARHGLPPPALHRRLHGQRDGFYRFRHIERGMGMILKSVGLPPRGRLSVMVSRLAWRLLQRRRRRFAGQIAAT